MMQTQHIRFGTVDTVGIKKDEHAYFVSGNDGNSYFGRQKNRDHKLKADDVIVFVANETRIVDVSVSLLNENAALLLSIDLDSFLNYSPIWQRRIVTHCELSTLTDWWMQQSSKRIDIPTQLLLVIGGRISPKSDKDPLFIWSSSTSPEVTHFLNNKAGHGPEALIHRINNAHPRPSLSDFPVEFVLEVYRHSSSFISASDEARELLFQHKDEQAILIAEYFLSLTNSDLRSAAIEWAQTTKPPCESKCFVYSDVNHFLELTRTLDTNQKTALLSERLRTFPNDSVYLTDQELWTITPPPRIWDLDQKTSHHYLLLASEHASASEIVEFLPILNSLSPFINANDFGSDTDLAICRIGERFHQDKLIPDWMKSYVTTERPWSMLTEQQKMNVIMREHVQKPPVSTTPEQLSDESSLVKALKHFSNHANERKSNSQFLDVLQLLRERLEAEWTARSQTGDLIDNTPLLARCTKPLISDKVIHCEGRLHLERYLTGLGENKWKPVSPWRCRCPRTSDSCEQWNNLLPDTSKPWWRWSLNELIEQAGADYEAIGQRFIDDANVGVIYVNRLAGVANRVNELTDRLRCRGCNDRLTYRLTYAKNPAQYMNTLTSPCARSGPNCDGSVYINHCLGCSQIIDSRDSRFQIQERYNCINCATAHSVQNAGDWCPNCGAENSIFGVGQVQRCRTCEHQIRLPASSRRARQQRARWN